MAGKSSSDGSRLIAAVKPPVSGSGRNSGGVNGTGEPAVADAGKSDAGKSAAVPLANPFAGKPDAGKPDAGKPAASGIGELAATLPPIIRPVRNGPGIVTGNDANIDADIDAAFGGGGNAGADYDPFERDAAGNTIIGANGQPKRKRGRKPGANSGPGNAARPTGNKTSLNNSIDRLAANIGILHLGIASLTKNPELELEDAESRALALATQNVLEQFATEIDPRVTAVVGLVTTAGSIYGPRAFLIRERKRNAKPAPIIPPIDIPTPEKQATPETPTAAVLYPFGKKPN